MPNIPNIPNMVDMPNMVDKELKYLVTTKTEFVAPDGKRYSAVWGTVTETLGSEHESSLVIGNMMLAGSSILYVIRADVILDTDGENRIYNADNKW